MTLEQLSDGTYEHMGQFRNLIRQIRVSVGGTHSGIVACDVIRAQFAVVRRGDGQHGDRQNWKGDATGQNYLRPQVKGHLPTTNLRDILLSANTKLGNSVILFEADEIEGALAIFSNGK